MSFEMIVAEQTCGNSLKKELSKIQNILKQQTNASSCIMHTVKYIFNYIHVFALKWDSQVC